MILKRARELDIMAEAAVINREALESIEPFIKPGVSTRVLNDMAEDAILTRGGRPAFKGYRGFPAALCCSVNEVVVHGFPSDKPLLEGDILSIDVGTFYRGYAADMAKTYPIGNVSAETQRLLTVTENSLYAGIEQAYPGNRLGRRLRGDSARHRSGGLLGYSGVRGSRHRCRVSRSARGTQPTANGVRVRFCALVSCWLSSRWSPNGVPK